MTHLFSILRRWQWPAHRLARPLAALALLLATAGAASAQTPNFAAQATFAAGGVPQSVAAADVNGDGKPDLLVANEVSDNVSVLLNTTAPGAAAASFAARASS